MISKTENMNNLVIKRKVGGSVIERRPVFSPNGKHLCVVENECVRVYSTTSGECTLELYPPEGINSSIVGIAVDKEYIFGVTPNGFLIRWTLDSTKNADVMKFVLPQKNCIVFDLVIFDENSEVKNSPLEIVLIIYTDDGLHLNKVTLLSFKIKSFYVPGVKNCEFSVKANNDIHSITFGGQYNKKFVASILGYEMQIYWYGSSHSQRKIKCPREEKWTVVRAHPVEDCVAAGDRLGRVYLYYDLMSSKVKDRRFLPRSIYQWHVLPLADVMFSSFGSQIFSGGSECVFVKWQISKQEVKHFLPRLPAPVVHISVSPMSQEIAISLQNNSIVIVNSQLYIECTVQQFTWGLIPAPGQELFPAGICRDPNSNSLVLNGHPGHLQFYSLETETLLYNLDITEMNYLTQEPDTIIYNVEVTRFAFSQDGKWLATVESRNDFETMPEIHLKIWLFNQSNKRFHLNTYCDLPHQDLVNAIKFQPVYSSNKEKRSEYCMVTTGSDNKFRVWLTALSQETKKSTVWKCDRIGFYKDFPAGPAGFSYDGSVLAVGFGPCLTIWDVDNQEIVASLTRDKEYLRYVEIEQKNYSHLVVSCTSTELCVWNLLTLVVSWTVSLNVSVLVSDPLSEYMAAFTRDNALYVFKPSSSEPVYEKHKVVPDGNALAAIFVPQDDIGKTNGNKPNWMHESQLYFITSKQELMCVGTEIENSFKNSLVPFSLNEDNELFRTPYAALIAKQRKVMKEDFDDTIFKNRSPVGLVSEKAVRDLLSSPVHAMPQLYNFCNQFLRSFVSSIDERSSLPSTFNDEETTKTMKNKKKKSKLKKFAEKYDHAQRNEFKRMFETDFNVNEKESMEIDEDNLIDIDSGVNTDNDDVVDEDNNKKNKVSEVVINKMFTNMKNSKKNKANVKKKKKFKDKSKSEFIIDEAPDLGLLNLFKNG